MSGQPLVNDSPKSLEERVGEILNKKTTEAYGRSISNMNIRIRNELITAIMELVKEDKNNIRNANAILTDILHHLEARGINFTRKEDNMWKHATLLLTISP